MKKFILVLLSLCAATLTFAQKKGDMYVGGTIGMNVGGTNISLKVGNEKVSSKSPFSNSFNISPSFGYFVMDQWEVGANLKYSIMGMNYYDEDNHIDGRSGGHQFSVGIGSHYHLRIADRFYYAPGLGLDFGLLNSYSKEESVRTSDNFFMFGLSLDLGSFEFQINDHFALDLQLLSFNYQTASKSEKSSLPDTKVSMGIGTFSFTTGTVGVKYYF